VQARAPLLPLDKLGLVWHVCHSEKFVSLEATPAMPDVVYTPTGSQSPETQHKIEQILKGFQQKRLRRYNFEMQWQESSLLAWPEHANTFFYGYDQYPGAKKAQQQIDSSASIASHYFGAIMDSLLTPQGLMWSRLKHPDKDVMKQRGVQAYY